MSECRFYVFNQHMSDYGLGYGRLARQSCCGLNIACYDCILSGRQERTESILKEYPVSRINALQGVLKQVSRPSFN